MSDPKIISIKSANHGAEEKEISLTTLINIKDSNDEKIFGGNLAKVFNYYMAYPEKQEHALFFWNELKKNLEKGSEQNEETSARTGFLIKYLFLDSFGCSVPPFIDFEWIIIESTDIPLLKFKFDTIKAGFSAHMKDYTDIKEIQTGW